MIKKLRFQLLTLLFVVIQIANLSAQRPMEKLDRSVVAQKVSNGVYVNWRITSDEWHNTAYKLYRDGSLIYTTTTTGASNYLDAAGSISSKYTVSAVRNGIESTQSAQASVLTKSYLEIPMRDLKSLGKNLYYLNDATAADLDGDGQYEVIIKRMNRNWEASCVDFTYFEAYKMDGTFMWAIDVGPNITMDVEINIAAFDFDGDGKAEVFMRSSDGTIFGLDKNNQNGTPVGDRNADGYINYRQAPFNGIGGDGFMNAGPEYLSLIDGMTGKELDWVNFIPRGTSGDWGDDYGHRANKFFFGAPYLDGKKPSLFIGRGIYTMHKMQTYDIVNKKLVKKWYWETTYWGQTFKGKWDDVPKSYMGQGYHNYTIADVDDDGKDEINWGSMTIDDDGKPLYSTELGHGDAQHYGDLDPYRKGQEMFACNETSPGTNLRDAKTGKMLYRKVAPKDVGRAGAGNITDLYPGAEIWGSGVGLSATNKVEMSHFGVAENYCVYWDGDLCQELLDHSGFSTGTGVGYGAITKFNGYGNISTLLSADAYSCNYTKGTPCLQADIMGDWREEAIWWRSDSMALRIYTTPIATTNRIYTLMHDHQYRQAICWQMCGYNQPPHTSFYLGSDFPTPIPAKSTNGKLVWKGNTSTLDASTANFMSGDDAAGLLAGTATSASFSNGKSILLDDRSTNKTINLNENIEPELLMVSGNENYSISGSGVLSGNMILDKMGENTLALNGNHTYTGKTNIWEGNLWLTGSLSASPVTVRRHANFGGIATLGSNLTTEYNAIVYPGGQNLADTLKINGNLSWVAGAKLVYDLSDNPNIFTGIKGATSSNKNDYLQLNGTLQLGNGAILLINQLADSLTPGKYLLMKANALTGSLSAVKVQGTGGKSVELTYDATSKELYLIVKGTRGASKITWTGKTDAIWNMAKTANWSNEGFADIFVTNDSVYFDGTGLNRTITLVDSLAVSHMEVNSPLNYTFNGTGALTGAMDLVKSGSGTLYLNTRNNFTGKTIVEAGSLIMQYAPSITNNGGIGTNNTNAAFLVVKDSAILQITTANEQTSRGMTLAGTAGGLLNVTASLYWNGIITGTKLTKYGAGTLYIANNNSTLTESVLKAGIIKLNTDASVSYGVGKKVILMGGTLETLNNNGAYLSSNHNIEVPAGYTSTVIAGARIDYNGALTGSGTLNWNTDFIRAYINGNWSAFAGALNITKNGANSTYEDKFIFNNSNGLPLARVNIATGVTMCYKNGTSDNGTTTIKLGMLSGAGNFYNAGLEVGASNANGSFSGVISGATSVKKLGTGLWVVSGANTYTGTTLINEGTLTLSGSLGAGNVTVANGALMNLTGTVGGSVIVSSGGTLYVTGSVGGLVVNSGTLKGTGTITGNSSLANNSETNPGSSAIGTLNFKGNLTMASEAFLNMQISGTASADKIAVTGAFTCNGILNISILSGIPSIGSSYQIISAGSITGTFTTINLPELESNQEWDLSELYSTGTIKVRLKTITEHPEINISMKQNPSDGIFEVLLSNPISDALVVVSDLQGKVLFENKIGDAQLNIKVNLSNMSAGIYLMKIMSDSYSNTFKLIKKN